VNVFIYKNFKGVMTDKNVVFGFSVS